MLHLLLTTLLPIILLIALGTFLRLRGFLADGFWPGAERLSYYILLPSLFLHGLATANLDGVPVLGMVGVLMLSTLAGAVLLVLYQGAMNHDGADFTSVFQGGIRFNNYIGATLAAGIYGSAGIVLAAVANAAIVPLVNLLCVLVFARFSARHSSPATVLRAIFANPLIVGCAGGGCCLQSGVGSRFGSGCAGRRGRVELHAELHRRIEEAFDGREWIDQRFRNAIKGETDFEGGLGDLEIPILVLDDDRHFLVVLTEQFLAEANAGGARHEGNEEVVVTGKPGLGDFGQNLAHDAAQGFLGENVVSHMIFGHDYPSGDRDRIPNGPYQPHVP